MQRNRGSRFFPLFVAFVVFILIVVAIVSIGRAIFSGSQKDTTEDTADHGRQQLLVTDAGSSVVLTTRGPIVSRENFRSYQVVVSPTQRSMTVYKGYLESVDKNTTLPNDQKAYEQFVYALDKANMMKGKVPADDSKNDLRGICSSGYVYEYTVRSGDNPVKRLWTSTCDGSKGTLDASVSQLNGLFFKQIPDADKIDPFASVNANPLKF